MTVLTVRTRAASPNILLVTDGSTSGGKALHYALALAEFERPSVHLAQVIAPTVLEVVPVPELGARNQSVTEQTGLTLAGHLKTQISGPAADTIAALVRENHIDLVIVNAHDLHGLSGSVLGSTAEQILRVASCPVLTIGPNVSVADNGPGMGCILLPTDLISDMSCALSYAISRARVRRAQLVLLHVRSDVRIPGAWERDWTEQPYLSSLRRVIPVGTDLPCPVVCRIEYANSAVAAIVEVARELSADLLVLNMPSATASDEAYQIVAAAPCPVVSVRDTQNL